MDKDNNLDLELELKETYDQLLRVSAEFENYKKRKDREVDKFKEYANENLLKELIDTVDSLEKIVDSDSKGWEKYHEGLKIILNNLMLTLKKFGFIQIKSKGTAFNPKYHEALGVTQTTRKNIKNTVVDELNKGYLFKDRLLKPAKVIVVK